MYSSSYLIIDPTTDKLHCWECGTEQFCEAEKYGSCACCDCSPHQESLVIPRPIVEVA